MCCLQCGHARDADLPLISQVLQRREQRLEEAAETSARAPTFRHHPLHHPGHRPPFTIPHHHHFHRLQARTLCSGESCESCDDSCGGARKAGALLLLLLLLLLLGSLLISLAEAATRSLCGAPAGAQASYALCEDGASLASLESLLLSSSPKG